MNLWVFTFRITRGFPSSPDNMPFYPLYKARTCKYTGSIQYQIIQFRIACAEKILQALYSQGKKETGQDNLP